MTLINIFLSKIPDYLFPFGGIEGYAQLWEKYGDMHPYVLSYRVLWHAIGGCFVVKIETGMGVPYPVALLCLALIVSSIEMIKNEGTRLKQVIDAVSWTLGGLIFYAFL